MSARSWVITSDVHLGNRHQDPRRFLAFLTALAPETGLVLGGDVVDRNLRNGSGIEREILALLAARSQESEVVWVRGNHDAHYQPSAAGRILFVPEYSIGGHVYVAHGHYFDNLKCYHQWFITFLLLVHHARRLLGAESVHVARFARHLRFLYGFFCRHVADNAIEHARETGHRAVVCGHTHRAEQRARDGILYFNTGAWTDPAPATVVVRDGTLIHGPATPEET